MTNTTATAERHNEGKPRLSFNQLGREAQEAEARVWEFGAQKYAPGQWLKGLPTMSSCDSLLRHLTKFMEGQDLDEETGLPHAAHLVTCAKILLNSFLTRPDLDDRPIHGPVTSERSGPTAIKILEGSYE